MSLVDPRVVELQTRMFAHGIKPSAVLKRANVSASTWWRWTQGGDLKRATLIAVTEALEFIIRNPQQETTHGS